MCKDYALNMDSERFLLELNGLEDWPPAAWKGPAPHFGPEDHIRITDRGLLVHMKDDRLGVELLPWAWEDRGHYLFNLCVEKRSLGKSIRCLIAATGFYIYTMPTHPGQQQDQHLFRLKGRDWFWIAGIIRHGAFAMLTRTYAAMPSMRHRQVCILPPEAGLNWLKSADAGPDLLTPLSKPAFEVRVLRKNRATESRHAMQARTASASASP
ncbi:MAG TPA: SOS response-associated peptidase family protein [Rhizomicrobium sp.]|nr:SOS response-associated peptidase family protein [Rhizomicrobium sp.]